MDTKRLSITIPADVAGLLSGEKNKSAFIADAIKLKKQIQEQNGSQRQLEDAYKQAAIEDYETCHEWEDTVGDGLY
ncbi:MAG: hypothetical protein HQK92_07980 [Nitrospirae bacterium]|nr:hypothetical protein [Nitrospirota bacterium]